MAIKLPDLIIESVIRDGLENIKARPEILDDVFGDLLRPFASRKYGVEALDKIKELLTGNNPETIAVVHSFYNVNANLPCYSINMTTDGEDQRLARLDDFDGDKIEALSPAEVASLVRVLPFDFTYEATSGFVQVADSVNLSAAFPRFLFVDADENTHEIIAISEAPNGFFIQKGLTLPVGQGYIKSFLDFKQTEIRGVEQNVQLLIGVHTREELLTKYLYALLKYILLSRKTDTILRGMYSISITGSDFSRDQRYEGNHVFTRFLTVSGKVNDSWRADHVDLIDSVIFDAEPCDEC